jgi:hypothetical protein
VGVIAEPFHLLLPPSYEADRRLRGRHDGEAVLSHEMVRFGADQVDERLSQFLGKSRAVTTCYEPRTRFSLPCETSESS